MNLLEQNYYLYPIGIPNIPNKIKNKNYRFYNFAKWIFSRFRRAITFLSYSFHPGKRDFVIDLTLSSILYDLSNSIIFSQFNE